MPETRHVDVLLVNYLTGDLTVNAARAVRGPGVHLWVWDNSGELLAEHLHDFDVVDGDGSNYYFAAANNALARRCDGPLVLLLNPDVELSYDSLQALVRAMDSKPSAWGVAPRLLNEDGSDQNYLHRLPDLASLLADRVPALRRVLRAAYARYVSADLNLKQEQVVDQPPAACLLVRRDVIGENLFDERYRLFFNDADLARRLNANGTCWYVPSVTARHFRGESFRRVRHRGYAIAREYDRSLLRYARRNVRGWQVLVPVIGLRLLATAVSDLLRAPKRGSDAY